MPDQITLRLAGEEVVALAEKALFWPRGGTVFVADVHFGKDATFRRAGRWIPPGTTTSDLARLREVVERTAATRLIILGDAFHSEHAEEEATFAELQLWKSTLAANIAVVKGNHDRRAGELAARLGFEMLDEGFHFPPWVLCHHPVSSAQGYVLCGHLHPVVSARGPARQSVKAPCFWIGGDRCVLPAFSEFTGGATVRPRPGDRVLLAVDGRLVESAGSRMHPSIASSARELEA